MLEFLSARDPGRTRLKTAVAMSAGVLASALFTSGVIHVFHADSALLATGVFLSVQAGIVVDGPTARSRIVTAGLLIPAVILAVAIAALVSWRPAVIAVFVALTGLAVWIRRFGPRTTAIGTMGFLAYFFTLFVHPTAQELPAYCLISASAAAAQLIVQVALWATSRRPERELAVLLIELRIASTAALQGAVSAGHTRTLRTRLTDVDTIGSAITSWQQRVCTPEHIGCDEETLAVRVLDARVDLEEVCLELTRTGAGPHRTAAAERSLAHLRTMLDERASQEQCAAAASWAERTLAREGAGGALEHAVAQSILAHSRLRAIDLHRPKTMRAPAAPPPPPHRPGPNPDTRERAPRWRPWRDWAPTTRLAVQAMTAAAIAAAAGEAISASRWYWAVLTAFLIFVSTTTRSGILTRAYHRVAGTALGALIGTGAAFLAHDNHAALIAICVISVFGMIYLGLLNYLYSPLFMTILLVALYQMLGVLHGTTLELRILETLTGGVIGVLCAYLILSSNSRPALVAKVDAYFDALDALLLQSSTSDAAPNRSSRTLARIQALETAQADLDQTVSAMSAAFLIGQHEREETATHLIHVSTRSAVRFAQVRMTADARPVEPSPLQDPAVARARAAAARVRRQMDRAAESGDTAGAALSDHPVVRASRGDSDDAAAQVALDRLQWALAQLSEVLAPKTRRSHPS